MAYSLEEVAGFAEGAAVVEVEPAVVVVVPSGSAEGVAELVGEVGLCAVVDVGGAVVVVDDVVVDDEGVAPLDEEVPEEELPRMFWACSSAEFMFLMSAWYPLRSPFLRAV
jgi:hypothetical protein